MVDHGVARPLLVYSLDLVWKAEMLGGKNKKSWFSWNRGKPKVEKRVTVKTPVKTKCPINVVVTTTNWETAAPFSPRDPTRGVSALPSHRCLLASSLGTRGVGRVRRRESRERRECPTFVWREMRYQRFLMAAPLEWGGNFGRQGSSAPASWEKTESSPEEQVELRVSG